MRLGVSSVLISTKPTPRRSPINLLGDLCRTGKVLDTLGGRQPRRQLHVAVVGPPRSIRQWVLRPGLDGRLVKAEQEQGIPVAALGALVGYHEYN